jgi:hypothetical protein
MPAPWQNGTAERWIGSCRREILDHIIAVNEEHLRRLIRDYVRYHHIVCSTRAQRMWSTALLSPPERDQSLPKEADPVWLLETPERL